MLSTVVRLRPLKTAPKSKREYDYVLDQNITGAFPQRLQPCTLNRNHQIQMVHSRRDIRHTEKHSNADFLRIQAPILVARPPSANALELSSTARSRFRLVHNCYEDLSERPSITQRLRDVYTIVGRNVTLEVRATGFPDCDVLWYKDEQPLTRHRPINYELRQYSKGVFVLHIRGASTTDAGIYSCRLYNCAGEVRTSAYVNVEPYRGEQLPVRLSKTYNVRSCIKTYVSVR